MTVLAELSDEALAFLKEAGHEVVTFAKNELSKLIVYLRTNEPLVTKALNTISDLESKTMTGPEKMAALVKDIEDDANTFIAEGGPSGIVSRGIADLTAFGETVFADFQADIAKL